MLELDVLESKSSLHASNYCAQIMKSYIWLQTVDGSLQQAEQAVAMLCPVVYQEIHAGKGTSKNHPICLPQRVNPAMLSLILDYCRFHQVPGHSNKERKYFDEKFIRMDTKRLCELASASDSLQLKPLVELASRALARTIEGKTPEEIRDIFCLPDDLTEEEKLEPLQNMTVDPRIRLLNRLYAKRRKELKEKQKMKTVESEKMNGDNRSLDDLLSFINGDDEEGKLLKTSKSKKKQRKKDHTKNSPLSNGVENQKDTKNYESEGANTEHSHGVRQDLSGLDDGFISEGSVDDCDSGIDPAIKEQIDREVEDFTRRLNLNWSERMRELLYGSRTEVRSCIH